jgi:hypothetical protein
MASQTARERGDSQESNREDEPGGWLERTWYRSGVGIGVVVGNLLLTVVLAAAAVVVSDGGALGAETVAAGIVPPYVHVFSLLGALGFVFTALIEAFDCSVGTVLRYTLRLPAALPLGVGIFLLSEVILGEAAVDATLVAGVVFLTGLYVNLAYKRLGALARRLLPGSGGTGGADGDASAESTDGDGSGAGENDETASDGRSSG